LTTVDCGPRDHSAWAWPAVGNGQWPLGTSSAQFTVYRLRHSCPTARTAARPIPEGMTIFCLVSFTTGAVQSAMPATAGLLVLYQTVRRRGQTSWTDRQTDGRTYVVEGGVKDVQVGLECAPLVLEDDKRLASLLGYALAALHCRLQLLITTRQPSNTIATTFRFSVIQHSYSRQILNHCVVELSH